MQFLTFVPHREQTLVKKDSPSSRTTKSSFFSSSANFGNVSPFLVAATNTFSHLIHPLIKLPNCVLKQQLHILQFIRSIWLFRLSPSSRSRHRLCWRTATSTHFWSSTIYTTFHYIHCISQRSNSKNCFRISGLQRKDLKPSAENNTCILPRNQSPSVSNSQRGQSCEQIFDSSTTFLNPRVITNSLYGKLTVIFFFLLPHMSHGGVRLAPFTRIRLLCPTFRFLYWFWEKNRLFCSLQFLGETVNTFPGCKENHFYSLPFGQAEASIY